jgi:2-desacetyl-2-hydroxyethyl bacteriochlorophyllide A dehydrogenase
MKQVRVEFVGKGEVQVAESELPQIGAGEVLVESEVSLMSTGTENIVLNRMFDAGTHWDKWVKYPFYPGYATVGIVREKGEGVESLGVGARVAHRRGHASAHVLDQSECFAVPAGVIPEEAVWFALGRITHNGARNVGFGLGQNILVIGAGPIGQMTMRWALATGAERVMAVDSVQLRLDIAQTGGVSCVFQGTADEAEEAVLEHFGALPDIVADTTGYADVFDSALHLVKTQGRLLLVGDTGSPASQRLTPDVVTRGISVVGAHDANTYLDRDRPGINRLFWELVRSGRIRMHGLNTHEYRGENAPDAYKLANTRRGETLGILFRWN